MLGLQYPAATDLDIDLTVLSDSRIESPLSWLMYFMSIYWVITVYPLVNIQKTMENHHL
jgi:hypothetical protein